MLSSLAAAFRSSVLQSAARDLPTLAHGLFARASRSLSAVFLPRSQDEKRVLVARSSRQRSAIYRRSRTVCSLAHRALCPLSSSLAPKTKSVSWSLVRPDSGARFIDARERCVRSRIALFVHCLPLSLPRRKACLGRSFVQTAERDLSTLANGVFARASRSLSTVFLSRSQDEKRVLVARSSRQRSAIYRRSRTVCALARSRDPTQS